ncbi:MAG TPA: transglutaminase-like domain-containing protein [Gemmatimonadales bacterium]|nr:transglutaminase-like domain-containing protein [Gemmatimonadales bacterium]
MTRGRMATLVLSAWAAALGWLLMREYRPDPGQFLAEATLSLPPGATYYALSLGGVQIGFASNTVDTLADSIRVEDIMVLEVPALGNLHRTDARTRAILTRQLRLRSFDALLRGDLGEFAARGQVQGDSVLRVEFQSGGSTESLRVGLERPVILPGQVPLHVAFGQEVRLGGRYRLRMFDPLILKEREIEIRITGDSTFVVPDSSAFDSTQGQWVAARWDTVHAYRVEQDLGGLAVSAWIDDVGRVVRATSAAGFTMERSAFELAHENFRRKGARPDLTGAGDLIRQTAIASNVRLAGTGARALRVRLTGVDLRGFDLDGGRQRLAGDTLVVAMEPARLLEAGYSIPAPPSQFAPFIRPEPLVQSDDPRIQAQARQIVGRRRDPRRVAEMLNRWVYDNLEKVITVSVPSAVQVLEGRRGDCNEHTVLYVALARALGLPARTAAGLVYLDGRFYYHAWPEVHLGDWVAVDPTFGQVPADASHLRFTIGGLARQVELIRLIGRLNLDVVSSEPMP